MTRYKLTNKQTGLVIEGKVDYFDPNSHSSWYEVLIDGCSAANALARNEWDIEPIVPNYREQFDVLRVGTQFRWAHFAGRLTKVHPEWYISEPSGGGMKLMHREEITTREQSREVEILGYIPVGGPVVS